MSAPRWLRICVKCLRWIAVALFMVEAYHVAYYYPKDGFDVFLRYILPPLDLDSYSAIGWIIDVEED
jgi:hypothetical protein